MGQTEVGKQSKRDGTHQFVTCVFLFIACMLLYSSNLKTTPFNQGYDTIPARLIPFSILKYHSFS